MNNILPLPALRNVYGSLTNSEKQLAEFLSDHTEEFMQYTVPELAEATGISAITCQRFCKKLGFNGMRDLKLAVAMEVSGNAMGNYGDIFPHDGTADIARKLFGNIVDGLNDSLKLLDFQQVEAAADVLDKAKRIALYGYGNSATVCRDMETRFLRFGLPAQAYSDSHQQITSAALLTGEDAVVAVSHSGETLDLLESVAYAKRNHAKVIAITSHAKSDLAREADIVLHGMGREVNYRSESVASRFVHIAIADVLYTILAMKHPQRYNDHLAKMREAIGKKRKSGGQEVDIG